MIAKAGKTFLSIQYVSQNEDLDKETFEVKVALGFILDMGKGLTMKVTSTHLSS